MWRDLDGELWLVTVIGAAVFWTMVLIVLVAVVRGEWAEHHRDHRGRRSWHGRPRTH